MLLSASRLTVRKPFFRVTGSRHWPEARVCSRNGCSTSSQKLWWARMRLGTFPNRVSADTWRRGWNSAAGPGQVTVRWHHQGQVSIIAWMVGVGLSGKA